VSERDSRFSFDQIYHTLRKIEAVTSTLNSDNPTDNCILELDDVLEAVCTKVGTNTILKVERRQEQEGYEV
jgi:hypothetical protein